MTIKDRVLNKAGEYVDNLRMTSGDILKRDLGLSKFQHVYIQQIIDISYRIYVITVNSRYPDIYIPRNKVKDNISFSIEKINKSRDFEYGLRPFKLTPPIYIEEFDVKLHKDTMIIRKDIGAENYVDEKMYESIQENNKIKFIEVIKMEKYKSKWNEVKSEKKEEKSDEEKAQDAIKGVIEKDWGGSNDDQYGAVQLLSGLASNDSKIANDFMSDLNKLTDKMDLSKYGIK